MKISQLPITPIVTIIIGKILGIFFTSIVFAVDFEFSNIPVLFSLSSISDKHDLILISSYSDLFMFTVLSTGLVMSLMLHTNKAHLNLTKMDIESFINSRLQNFLKTAYKLYGQALHWFIVLGVSNFYVLYNTLTGKTYLWIYLLILLLTFSLSLYFYYDIMKEVELGKRKLFKNE